MNPRTIPGDSPLRPHRGGVHVTVVGDPAFDDRQLPWLARLPGARGEARAIADVYGPGADLLLGEAATPEALRTSVRGAAVLHVAAHTLSGGSGEATALVLAGDREGGSSGLLGSDELAQDVEAADLVVLSACSTLEARGSDGLIGLAGPFLSRGSRAVVGTLWQVDDAEVADWTVEFHRLVASGNSASVALQRVQSRAASSGRCCPWAAFALVGDVTLRDAHPPSNPVEGGSIRNGN
jgi:CHAT domain-containing protein